MHAPKAAADRCIERFTEYCGAGLCVGLHRCFCASASTISGRCGTASNFGDKGMPASSCQRGYPIIALTTLWADPFQEGSHYARSERRGGVGCSIHTEKGGTGCC